MKEITKKLNLNVEVKKIINLLKVNYLLMRLMFQTQNSKDHSNES